MEPAFLAAVAVAIILYGAISQKMESGILTPPIFFVFAGYAVSKTGLGWLDFSIEHNIIDGLAEITLVVVLFTDASRIDLSCLRREGGLPTRLLGIGLPLTIVAGALGARLLFPGFGIFEALLLSAILAPTDAALGQAVVSSPFVPTRIRQTLNVESGLNDGIVLPVVLVMASLASAGENAEGIGYWLRFAALAVILGPLVGAGVGYAGARLLRWGREKGWITIPFEKLIGLGIAALAFAGAELVGGNGFIAAFVAGLTVGNAARDISSCIHEFGEAEGQLLTLLVFLIFGGAMVPHALEHATASTFIYAALSLTVVRMLPVALSLIGSNLHGVSFPFIGWFGPRGLASILFALLVLEEAEIVHGTAIEATVMITVLMSTIAHGVTANPLAKRYGAYLDRIRGEEAMAEHMPTTEMPVRVRRS